MNTLPRTLACAWVAALATTLPAPAGASDLDPDAILQEIQAMKDRIRQLEDKLEQARVAGEEARREAEQARQEAAQARQEAQETADQTARTAAAEVYDEKDGTGIDVHGAVRFQYSYEDYNDGNRDREGDLDFDTFRINLDGSIGDVLLSAEYRFYQYMHVVHHAWVGYDFTPTVQGQLGIHRVPFGVLPYNSHSYFFSSNYYLGLEDDYDAGLKLIYDADPLNVQLAFYKNDEQGGVDGFVEEREDRYSYDVVGFRGPGEGTFAEPGNPVGETNTFNGRIAYTLHHGEGLSTELGASGQYGSLHDGSDDVGDHSAYAVHLVGNYGRWNIQLQATDYDYDMDSGADRMAVGAYSFFDTIPAEANTYTANVAYSLPVSWGPVSNLTFYNDYSLVTDKSADLEDTWMNVTGVAVTAGGLYTYFDFIMAQNQPFIGGSMDGDATDTNSRFNVNVGYYF
jgi:hypothetical protein